MDERPPIQPMLADQAAREEEQTERDIQAHEAHHADPTRWVREMLCAVLGTTEAVDTHEDQGRAEDGSGSVFFTDRDGHNYEIRIEQF